MKQRCVTLFLAFSLLFPVPRVVIAEVPLTSSALPALSIYLGQAPVTDPSWLKWVKDNTAVLLLITALLGLFLGVKNFPELKNKFFDDCLRDSCNRLAADFDKGQHQRPDLEAAFKISIKQAISEKSEKIFYTLLNELLDIIVYRLNQQSDPIYRDISRRLDDYLVNYLSNSYLGTKDFENKIAGMVGPVIEAKTEAIKSEISKQIQEIIKGAESRDLGTKDFENKIAGMVGPVIEAKTEAIKSEISKQIQEIIKGAENRN